MKSNATKRQTNRKYGLVFSLEKLIPPQSTTRDIRQPQLTMSLLGMWNRIALVILEIYEFFWRQEAS